jgi:uncharacterized protein (TIGR04255 family)
MPFPDSPRVIYDRNPLAEVICQFRFPTILRISSADMANFQDKIRAEYPLYESKEPSFEFVNVPKEFTALFEQLPFTKMGGAVTHKFSTKDKNRLISLSQDFLAFSDTKYRQWESYKKEIEKAEEALQQNFKPAFYSRIGLRYKDLINPAELGIGENIQGEKWGDLLQSHILGELGDKYVGDNIADTRTRSIIQIPEIEGANVTLIHGLVKQVGTPESYLIDADFALEKSEGINGSIEILDKFNRLAGRLFRWTITDTLHKAMGPQTIKADRI